MFSKALNFVRPRPAPASIPEPPAAPSSSEPAPVVVHKLDFEALGLPQYDGKFALVIDNLFTPAECEAFVRAAEASAQWEVAQINGGGSYQFTDTSYRNSQRIMLDDQKLADEILARMRPYLAEIEQVDDAWLHGLYGPKERRKDPGAAKLSRLNERLRFLQYGPGQFFKPHCDGVYFTPDRKEISYYTLQIYLNGEAGSLKGGATRFWSRKDPNNLRSGERQYVDVESRTGRVLVFEQNGLLHSGEEVQEGVKISVRTDFMYIATGFSDASEQSAKSDSMNVDA